MRVLKFLAAIGVCLFVVKGIKIFYFGQLMNVEGFLADHAAKVTAAPPTAGPVGASRIKVSYKRREHYLNQSDEENQPAWTEVWQVPDRQAAVELARLFEASACRDRILYRMLISSVTVHLSIRVAGDRYEGSHRAVTLTRGKCGLWA